MNATKKSGWQHRKAWLNAAKETQRWWEEYRRRHPLVWINVAGPHAWAEHLSEVGETLVAQHGFMVEAVTGSSIYVLSPHGTRVRLADHPPLYARSCAPVQCYYGANQQSERPRETVAETVQDIVQRVRCLEEFGAQLAQARIAAGLTVEEAAERAQIPLMVWTQIESGCVTCTHMWRQAAMAVGIERNPR